MINNRADKCHNIVLNNARIQNTKMKSTSKRSNALHKMIHEYIDKDNRLNNHNILQHKTKATNNNNSTKDNTSINNKCNNNKIKKDNNKKKTKHYNHYNKTHDHTTKTQTPKTNTTTQNNTDTENMKNIHKEKTTHMKSTRHHKNKKNNNNKKKKKKTELNHNHNDKKRIITIRRISIKRIRIIRTATQLYSTHRMIQILELQRVIRSNIVFRQPIIKNTRVSERELIMLAPFDFAVYGLASFDLHVFA